MRIQSLTLVRYGHFEGELLEFPVADHDIHIVYGENEAGKSTVLSSLGDVLFGIPERTTQGFRFKMSTLQIGATLENGKDSFSFVRRKGRGKTIIDADGTEIVDGEKTLRFLLNNSDREFFVRMFLLDPARLAAGSDTLLSNADAGESMLSSSAGIEGLHELLEALKAETENLWTPARKATREFYQAKKLLDDSAKAKRDAAVDTRQWKKVRQARDNAQAAFDDLKETIRDKRAERSRLDRVRRLHSSLAKLEASKEALSELADPAILPENAAETLRDAVTAQKLLQNKIDLRAERIETIQNGIARLAINDAVLTRADEIRDLDERRIQLKEHRNDLPRRVDRRDQLKESAKALAHELGWKAKGEIRDMLPGRPLVDRARQLATQHATLNVERRGLEQNKMFVELEIDRLRRKIDEVPPAIDLTALRAAVGTAKSNAGLESARNRAREDLSTAKAKMAAALKSLSPSLSGEDDLAAAIVPTVDAIRRHRDSFVKVVDALRAAEDERRALDSEINELSQIVDEKRDTIGAMSDADLQQARTERDDAWKLLAERYIHCSDYSDEAWRSLFGGDDSGDKRFPELIAAADEGADVRFDHARDVGEITGSEKQLAKLTRRRHAVDDDVDAARKRQETFEAEWSALWQGSPVTPETPDQGVVWLDQFTVCRNLLGTQLEAAARVEESQAELAQACAALRTAMTNVDEGIEFDEQDDLTALTQLAFETVHTLSAQNEDGISTRERLENAESQLESAIAALEGKDEDIAKWDKAWQGSLSSLNLPDTTAPDALENHLVLIDELREHVRKIDELQTERIEKIEQHIVEYEKDVAELAGKVTMDPGGDGVDDVVVRLVRNLEQSELAYQKKKEGEQAIADTRVEIESFIEDKQESDSEIARFAEIASADDNEALQAAASASDKRRDLEWTIGELTESIEVNGDKRTLEELREESKGVDLDTALATLQQVNEDLEDLESQLLESRAKLQEAEQALSDIGVEGDAAAAESARQQGLADMESVAERFVRSVTAQSLLQWSIDRFRLQNQKPLLERASGLFQTITRGSFEKIEISYDEDTPILAGRRPTDEITLVEHMSDGARDQLYLALRLAAVEEYAEKASAMPFVGDDLFIQHDRKRTREALRALVELSKTCQVILFSHDGGFVDTAREILPDGSNVITLESPVTS